MANRFGLEIRGAEVGDAAGVADLLRGMEAGATAASVAARLERLRASGSTVLLAVEWGPPSGVAVLHTRAALEADAPTAALGLLFVDPDARRRGLGRLLLKAASQAARQFGCADLHLQVPPDAPDLRAFCLACGFAPTGQGYARPLRKRG